MADAAELARQHDEAFNAQDFDARRRIESADMEVVMPGGVVLHGPDEAAQAVGAFWGALPDGKLTTETQFAEGELVVSEGVLRGKHDGPFVTPAGEVPPSGNPVSMRYVSIKRFTDDKLVWEHLYFDQLEFMQQIGAMPT